MQKVVKYLEANVQWVAMALGALFLVYTIYSYVLTKPVAVPVGKSTDVTPGQVDPLTLAGPGRALSQMVNGVSAPPMPVKNFVVAEQNAFSGTETTVPALAKPWTTGYVAAAQTQAIAVEAPQQLAKNPVEKLPEAPAPTDLKVSDGRSTVILPSSPVAAAGGAPGMAMNPPMNPANPPGAAINGSDVNWVSVSGVLPVKKLAVAFKACNIPPAVSITTVLRVQLVRQEQDAQGGWGPDAVLEPLKNVNLRDLPPPQARHDQELPYGTWAESDQVELVQPPFYSVIQGDLWRIPGGQLPPNPLLAAADAAFDPSKVTSRKGLSPENIKIYDDYLRQQEQVKKDKLRAAFMSRSKNGGSGGGPGGAPGGPPGLEGGGGGNPGGSGFPDRAVDNDAPILLAQARPGGFMPPGMPPEMPPGMPPELNPDMQMPGMPSANTAGQAVDAANAAMLSAAQATLPRGSFDPATQLDIIAWAHDASVQPGKTYRYKMRYILKNPVFQTMNLCKNQALSDQFMIQSMDSEWTDAISVKSDRNFFAVNASPSKDSVKFDVFAWKNGNWQVDTLDVTPGDVVGGSKGDGDQKVDFITGWTLVDVRTDSRNPDNKIIILTTDNGQTLRKELVADRASPEYKNLKAMVDAAKPKTTVPGQPGSPTALAPNANALFGQ